MLHPRAFASHQNTPAKYKNKVRLFQNRGRATVAGAKWNLYSYFCKLHCGQVTASKVVRGDGLQLEK